MNYRAILRRDWILLGWLLLDTVALFAIAVLLFPGDVPLGAAVVGGIFAASIGVRLGGEATLHDTWEFLLTRPLNRRAWIVRRFATGVVFVFALLLMFAAADAFDLHRRFVDLVVETDAVNLPTNAWQHGIVAAFVTLLYTVCFYLGLVEQRAEKVLEQRFGGVLMVAVLALVTRAAVGAAQDAPMATVVPREPIGIAVMFAVPVLLSVALLWRSTSIMERRELAGAEGTVNEERSNSSPFGCLILLVLVIAVVAILSWVLRPVSN